MLRQIFIFLGPPGSGKGSLSQLCVDRLGWTQLSTGNLFRKHIADQTSIGKQIDFAIKSGKLVSDSLVTEMVFNWLNLQDKNVRNIILDGFPRTLAQAKSFHDLIQDSSVVPTTINVVRLVVSDDVVISRLSSRIICKNNNCQRVYSLRTDSTLRPSSYEKCDTCQSPLVKRADDEQAAIKDRLVIYHKYCQELVGFYNKVNGYKGDLQGEQPLEVVYNQLISCLGCGQSK